MVVSTKQFRNLGVKVLLNKFGNDLFKNKARLIMLFSQVKLQPYSFLHWYKVLNKDYNLYKPLDDLCLRCSPLITIKEPSEAEKRKFRNFVTSIYNTVNDNGELDASDREFLESALIAIPVIEGYLYGDNKDDYKKIISTIDITQETWEELCWDIRAFTIDLIYWCELTSSESTLKDAGLTHQDLLETLLFSNEESFCTFIERRKEERGLK